MIPDKGGGVLSWDVTARLWAGVSSFCVSVRFLVLNESLK